MASLAEQNLLQVCRMRCSGLMSDIKSDPQLEKLHRQTKALRTSLRRMRKALHPYGFDSSDFNPTKHPGLSLLTSYLYNLRQTCGYYGFNAKTEWKLSSEQRASVLNESNNPFERLTAKLSLFALELKMIAIDNDMDGHKMAQGLCEWAESMIEHWDFFKGEFGAAQGLAAAIAATSKPGLSHFGTTIPGRPAGLHICKMASYHELERGQVWDSIRDELAGEGIGDDAIAKVAEDLEACVRDLVRAQRPEISPNEHGLTDHAVNTSESVANEELSGLRFCSETPLDRDAISSKVTAALNRINTEFHQVANEVVTIVLRKCEDNDTKAFRLVLDLIYRTACGDTTRSKKLARLAKHVQDNATPHIRELMTGKKAAGKRAKSGDSVRSPGPVVTGWLLGRCREAWTKGKNGSNMLSAEERAFGLPRFIGELQKAGVFAPFNVYNCIRSNWNSTMERDEFVAVYQLLRTTGGMGEGKQMNACFQNITNLIENDDTPEIVKELAQELSSLRSSGWKKKQTEVMDRVEEAIRKKTLSHKRSATFSGKLARLFVLVLITFVLINSRFRDSFPASYDSWM